MQDNARKITYGAMMIALFALFLAVTLYVPIVGNVTLFFIPLPILLYRLRYDRKSSIVAVVAGMFISMIVGGLLLIPFAFIHGLIGFVIGDTVKTGKSKLYTFMATGLALLVSTVLMYVAAVFLFNFNIVERAFEMLHESKEKMRTFMLEYGGLPTNFDEMVDSTFTMYEQTLPSMFIISIFILAFILVVPNLAVAKRLGHDVPKFPPFRDMKLPIITVIVYGFLLLSTLFMKMEPGSSSYLLSMNATVILRFLFLMQGIALIHYFINEMKLPKVATVFGTIFALLLSPMTTLIGILDVGVNIRAWIRKDKAR